MGLIESGYISELLRTFCLQEDSTYKATHKNCGHHAIVRSYLGSEHQHLHNADSHMCRSHICS